MSWSPSWSPRWPARQADPAGGAAPPRLLWVDLKPPTPRHDAASLRAVQLLAALGRAGWAVDFAAMFPAPQPADPADLAACGARPLPCADEASILAHVARHGAGYRAAVLCFNRVARRLLEPIRAAAPGCFIVFDTGDLSHVREFRQAKATGNAVILRRALQTKADELRLAAAADLTLVVTPVEQETLARSAPAARVAVLAMAAELGPAPPGPESRDDDLLFLGNYQAAPNADAARFLVGEILPLVRRRRPAARALLVGADPDAGLLAMASDHARFAGHAPDLAPVLGGARAMLAPLRFGAGIKGKMLSGLGHGLPIVASGVAAEGIGLVPEADYLPAESAAEFAAASLRLIEDPALWRRLSAAGRRAAERYSLPALDRRLAALLPSTAALGA
jgi:glycosyltransferase involved in cell wall biosynthesis